MAESLPRRAARATRSAIRKNPTVDRAYRIGVGATGGATVALGIALIPLPGPGALIALGGLAILGSEFEGAKTAQRKATEAAKRGAAAAQRMREKRAARKAARA